MECPDLVYKEKTLDKRKFKKINKGNRAYIACCRNRDHRGDEEIKLYVFKYNRENESPP